ncbi:MAG TPA: RibD family protein [Stellaceae bacterium]|jgi:riboflavin-specific deaminase-like protein|nr:RibD family protein [Stellaceae bacterium]
MAAEGYIRGHVEADWRAALANRRGATRGSLGAGEIESLYGPLCAIAPRQSFAVAHLAQSLDGKIAALSGASRWISGDEDLCHTHRMRALADAVVVGAETVLHDDPLLTVRRCSGTNPVRVVIDPQRKLKAHHKVFTDRGARTIVIAAAGCGGNLEAPDVETIALPREGRVIAPQAIKAALAARGLHWLFIEGGGVTISNFLRDNCLDRLQITVAPVILGSGRPSVTLPPISEPGLGLRPEIRRLSLGTDTLFECVFGL